MIFHDFRAHYDKRISSVLRLNEIIVVQVENKKSVRKTGEQK